MKKLLLLSIICLFTANVFGQLSLKRLNGAPINDGDVINFTSTTDPDNYLGIKIYNASPNTMRVKARVISITNADGTGIQLCFGNVCVATIAEGVSYPSGNPASIPAQGVNGNFDHFLNENTGLDTAENVEYTLKFYQIDSNGLEFGNSVTFTYKFSQTLATNNFSVNNTSDLSLKSNVVNNNLELEVIKNTKIEIFDTNGKQILNKDLVAGNQSIDVSNFMSGVYFLTNTNQDNKQSTLKFIKN